jgi:hypothetical protein
MSLSFHSSCQLWAKVQRKNVQLKLEQRKKQKWLKKHSVWKLLPVLPLSPPHLRSLPDPTLDRTVPRVLSVPSGVRSQAVPTCQSIHSLSSSLSLGSAKKLTSANLDTDTGNRPKHAASGRAVFQDLKLSEPEETEHEPEGMGLDEEEEKKEDDEDDGEEPVVTQMLGLT